MPVAYTYIYIYVSIYIYVRLNMLQNAVIGVIKCLRFHEGLLQV